MATGLNFLGSNMREIESAMETRANVELSAMEGNLGYLSLIARIAPMLGFVGTIWGVINIFIPSHKPMDWKSGVFRKVCISKW
jgi:biopolymer transport protein ExbB